MSAPIFSIVAPVYGCSASLVELYMRLDAALSPISSHYEIILIDDASPDDAWEVIEQLADQDARIKGIHLSRNFGQHCAIAAGLEHAQGDWIVVMDCDLQDMPEEIPKFYQKAQEGFDLVVGLRTNRQDSLLKCLSSRLFYWVLSGLSRAKINNRIGNFGIYSRRVIKSICTLREQSRPFGLLAIWVGVRRAEMDIVHAKRPQGESSYNLGRMITLALDSITAHSNRLLRFSVGAGAVLSVVSLAVAGWLVIRYLLWAIPVAGWTSLIVSIFLTTGLMMGAIGIMGLYIGKIFDEVKRRPLYIIESTTFD